jgi:hypothetical protein
MEVKLWNELSDQEAENPSGGQGIGQDVSSTNQFLKGQAQSKGYNNTTQALKNGETIKVRNSEGDLIGVYGFPYGQFVSDTVHYRLGKPL